MRNWVEVIGLIVSLVALGLSLLGRLEDWASPVAYVSFVSAIVLAFHLIYEWGKSAGKKAQFKNLELGEDKGQIVFVTREGDRQDSKRESWGGFTKAEAEELRGASITMRIYHGHIDVNGLVEALKQGESLNGACWLCGMPRFQKGGEPK